MNIEKHTETIESSVEKGINEALNSIRERYENQPEEKNNLPFHNTEHTKGVMRRTEAILLAIRKENPDLVNDHDIKIALLASAYHDTVQQWEENKIQDGEFTKVLRKRFAGQNETASSNEAVAFMTKTNENGVVFSDEDKEIIKKAIDATVPGWDVENKTVMQPNLKEDSSLVEIALALSDLATAGMGGAEKFIGEGKTLFREENLDILDAINGEELISDDKKEYFKKRMIGWLKSQEGFAKGRQMRLGIELQAIPEQVRKPVADLFDKFEKSAEAAKKVADEAEKMTFEELIRYFEY